MKVVADDLLRELADRGIEIRAEGERLRFRPAGAMPPELAAQIKAHKSELLAALATCDSVTPDKTTADGPESGVLSQLPPRPPDRAAFTTELVLRGGGWSWRQRRADAADRAYWAYVAGATA